MNRRAIRAKWLNYMQFVKTLIRRRVLRRLIWVRTVCQLPISIQFQLQLQQQLLVSIYTVLIRPSKHSCGQCRLNPCPAELGYTLPLQTLDPHQLAFKKPTDLDLHCLPFSMWIHINNLDQVIWLAEKSKKAWHRNLFSRTKVKVDSVHYVTPQVYEFHTRNLCK